MQLFYAPDIVPPLHTLNEEESKHCIRVLRLQCGGRIHITDGRGNLFCCEITDDNPRRCTVRVVSAETGFEKLPYALTMAVAPTKNSERFEWFLEKATEVGVTADMINDTNAQAELLSKIFAAQLPQLEPVVMTDDINGFIGFHPVTVNRGADSATVQIIGEIYLADKPMREMSEADYSNVQWLERAVFTFQSDSTALNGFRLMGYSVGTDLSLEDAMQGYFDQIAVEYESHLGFTLLYPAVFTDDLLVESDDGVSAELPDGSASFSAKRIDNTNGANLTDYVGIIANGITGSTSTINEESQYGTVAYTTEDGYYVFEVYIVTDRYIYQAELRFLSSLMSQYSMYTSYLENSFVANELYQG